MEQLRSVGTALAKSVSRAVQLCSNQPQPAMRGLRLSRRCRPGRGPWCFELRQRRRGGSGNRRRPVPGCWRSTLMRLRTLRDRSRYGLPYKLSRAPYSMAFHRPANVSWSALAAAKAREAWGCLEQSVIEC